MKKEYKKPYIYTAEIKEEENIAEETVSTLKYTGAQGSSLFGVISYSSLDN